MSKIVYDDKYSYEIFNDGYDIYKNDSNRSSITQRVPFDKPMNPEKTWEENAILQIQSLEVEPEPYVDPVKADLDFMALMLDIDLPSDEKGE